MPGNNDIESLQREVSQLKEELENTKSSLPPATDFAGIVESIKTLKASEKRRMDAARIRVDRLEKGIAVVNGVAPAPFLEISRRLSNPDDLATRALAVVKKCYKDKAKEALALVQDKGVATQMTKLTAALNNSGALDETNRWLLSDPDVYGSVLVELLRKAAGSAAKLDKFVADKEGFRVAVLAELKEDDSPRHRFVTALVKASLSRGGVQLDETKPIGKALIAELRERPVPLGAGRVESAIETAHERLIGEGSFPVLVDAYIETHEIDPNMFTPSVRQAMVEHLIARGVNIDLSDPIQQERFADGGYDEYFAVAYEQAVSKAAGGDDPIVAAATKGGSIAAWDFTVETFESIEEQGVVKENILAAGALDYVFELGERLGVYRLADALTLNWAAGAIDVVDGPCANRLYRYWKLRDQRMDPDERGLVYKRVLNKGDTEALERMVVNESFERLWGMLAEKVTEYRQKIESSNAETNETLLVSRAAIYQAVKDLQYNLSEFCTGMAHMQVREMYSQLRDAMDLLGDPEIVDHFAGGRRKTLWTVIERLAKSELGEAPNINAIRIAAVEGNAVFRFIATFQQGAVTEEQFQRFIEAMEAWIIAKGSDDSSILAGEEDEDDFEEDEDDAEDEDV